MSWPGRTRVTKVPGRPSRNRREPTRGGFRKFPLRWWGSVSPHNPAHFTAPAGPLRCPQVTSPTPCRTGVSPLRVLLHFHSGSYAHAFIPTGAPSSPGPSRVPCSPPGTPGSVFMHLHVRVLQASCREMPGDARRRRLPGCPRAWVRLALSATASVWAVAPGRPPAARVCLARFGPSVWPCGCLRRPPLSVSRRSAGVSRGRGRGGTREAAAGRAGGGAGAGAGRAGAPCGPQGVCAGGRRRRLSESAQPAPGIFGRLQLPARPGLR